ncbi:MAG: hypothetical protein IJ960_03280 [Oscillospiraceae bacterium]|nr:hypothetical protein [Oscillospiraceae bacterium]
MRRLYSLLGAVLAVLLLITPVFAQGQVIYDGNAGSFVFEPGSDYSPTDLFTGFKDVMPGDQLEQTVLLRNDADNEVKIKVYLRSLGAQPDSVEFLSQLRLSVEEAEETVLFDAAADQSAQLTDWVYLGTLYSGGELELILRLDVPVTLDNQFKNLVGYLDWEFMIEEYPVEDTDPEPPDTGDESGLMAYGLTFCLSGILLLFLLMPRRKQEHNT